MKNKKILTKVFGFSILIGSILVMLYPFISEYLFENRKDSLIETYLEQNSDLEDQTIEVELEKARLYNASLTSNHVQLHDPFKTEIKYISEADYNSILNMGNTGLIGYIKIPCIKVDLPIYHGTSSTVLENGVGHLEGTSFPIGGKSTHSVLTGHTGLNRAKLFTDLPLLKVKDKFFIYVLNEKMAYEVDQIDVVKPEEISKLTVEEGADYCTLITCTPYGINSHRLLVRGHRIPYTEETITAESQKAGQKGNSQWMREYIKAMIIGVITIIAILTASEFYEKRKTKKRS